MRVLKKQSRITPDSKSHSLYSESGGAVNTTDEGHANTNEGKSEKINSFSNVLKAKQVETKNKEIFSLVTSLDHLGDQLKKTPTLEIYNRYRNQIKNIIKLIVPKAVGLKRTFTRPNVQNLMGKEFHILNVIDQELDSLLKMIKEKEKNRLVLVDKVIGIKGLIIDLLK